MLRGVGAYRQYQLNQVALDGNTEGAAAEVATRMMTVEGYAQGRLTGMELGKPKQGRPGEGLQRVDLDRCRSGAIGGRPGRRHRINPDRRRLGRGLSTSVPERLRPIYANNVEAATASANERALNSAGDGPVGDDAQHDEGRPD